MKEAKKGLTHARPRGLDTPSGKSSPYPHSICLSILQEIASTPLSTWDRQHFCRRAAAQIAYNSGFERIFLLLQDNTNPSLDGIVAATKPKGRIRLIPWHDNPYAQLEETLVHKVLNRRIHILPAQPDLLPNRPSTSATTPTKPYLVLPIQHGNRVYGVLGCKDKRLSNSSSLYFPALRSLTSFLAVILELIELRDLAQQQHFQPSQTNSHSPTPAAQAEVKHDHRHHPLQRPNDFKVLPLAAERLRVISHEVRNPLAIIRATVDALSSKFARPDDPTPASTPNFTKSFVADELNIIKEEIQRIDNLMNRLQNQLVFPEPRLETLNLNDLIKATIRLCRWSLRSKHISFSLDLDPDVPCLRLSSDLMKQAFLNLIKNAEDAMPAGGKLSITTNSLDNHVEIEFGDSGVGIPKETMETLFSPFCQSDKGTGRGYGLVITHAILRNYNGRLSVVSDVDKGTIFKLLIPYHK